MRLRHRAPTWVAVSALLFSTASAQALGSGTAKKQASNSISFVERSLGKVQASMTKASAKKLTPEKRIANGEIFLRNKDYERAIGLFEQVIELHTQGKASVGADANARYWLGEAYFQDKQYLSARRHFRYLAEKGGSPAYTQYAGRSLSRMIDVALRTDKFDKLDEIFALINKLPASDQSGSLQYARGKAFYAKKELAASRSALAPGERELRLGASGSVSARCRDGQRGRAAATSA